MNNPPPPTDENEGKPCPECGGVCPWCNLTDRIQNYLRNGGLFNPEMMDHDKVRELLLDLRDAIKPLSVRPILPPASETATPTPETDAQSFLVDAHGEVVVADFARSLERRLAAAFKRVDEQFTEIQNLQSLHLKAFKESERLESDLLLARQQGEEMRDLLTFADNLAHITETPTGWECDFLQTRYKGITFLQMLEAAYCSRVAIQKARAALATPSPQGNNGENK